MATNHEKKKKSSFMNFYKSGSVGGDNYATEPNRAVTVLTMAPTNNNKPRVWLPKKKPIQNSFPEIKRVDDKSIVASKELKRGQTLVEARRSFSHVETNLAAEDRVVVVEARRSVSQVETNVASVMSFLQVKVLEADMPGFMQVHAFRCARKTYDNLEKFSSKHMAYNMKKEFDEVYGPAWHCIVGSSFGSFVTHGTGCFLYFSMEKLYVLLFKTKVQRAA